MRYQVLPNKTLRAPNGWLSPRLFGATMFDYLFVNYQSSRADFRFRSIYNPIWAGPATGVSEPTYMARLAYRNSGWVGQQLTNAWVRGVSIIRIAVEPAVMYATLSYVDPVDGHTYPSDLTMLDDIIAQATSMGMVVQLQMTNDYCPVNIVIPFLIGNGDPSLSIVARYANNASVWINPWNEPNGMSSNGANVNSVQAWYAKVQPCLWSIRSGNAYLGPVAIDPPGWASRIDLINSVMTTDNTFASDPNLIINVHYYPQPGDTNWTYNRLPALLTEWVNFLPSYCVMVGECGWNSGAVGADPKYSVWAEADFLLWANRQIKTSALAGVIGESWGGYQLPNGSYDPNVMFNSDSSPTYWGSAFQRYGLTPPR